MLLYNCTFALKLSYMHAAYITSLSAVPNPATFYKGNSSLASLALLTELYMNYYTFNSCYMGS